MTSIDGVDDGVGKESSGPKRSVIPIISSKLLLLLQVVLVLSGETIMLGVAVAVPVAVVFVCVDAVEA